MVGTLTPGQNNSYELVLGRNNNMSAVTTSWIGNYITATGTGDLTSGEWTEGTAAAADTKVFTRTFNGANTTDAAYSQTITLTVRLATVAEAAVEDIAAIRAAFPNSGYATGTVTVEYGGSALDALKTAVESKAIWGSNPTVNVNFVAGQSWNGGQTGAAQMHITVQAGSQSYTADVTVTFVPGT